MILIVIEPFIRSGSMNVCVDKYIFYGSRVILSTNVMNNLVFYNSRVSYRFKELLFFLSSCLNFDLIIII